MDAFMWGWKGGRPSMAAGDIGRWGAVGWAAGWAMEGASERTTGTEKEIGLWTPNAAGIAIGDKKGRH